MLFMTLEFATMVKLYYFIIYPPRWSLWQNYIISHTTTCQQPKRSESIRVKWSSLIRRGYYTMNNENDEGIGHCVTEDFPVIIFDWLFTYLIPNAAFVRIQFDPIGRFIILWTTFESPGQKLFCPNRQHISGNFCKGVKIFHYTRELRLGELLLTFGNFLLVTLFGFVRI